MAHLSQLFKIPPYNSTSFRKKTGTRKSFIGPFATCEQSVADCINEETKQILSCFISHDKPPPKGVS